MAATTLADLIEEVADAFGHYRRGTADAGSDADEIVDAAALYEPDDYWIGHYVYILEDAGGAGAAPEGEERPVTDYDQETATLTVSPDFTAAVGAGDTYELLSQRRVTIKRAINRAIQHADAWYRHATDDTTITLADDDYDYALPSDVVYVSQVWVQSEAGSAWKEVGPNQWHVNGEPGSQVLYFSSLSGLDSGYTLRIEYMARLSTLTDDTDTLGLGEPAETECVDFVVNYALHWLYSQAASSQPDSDAFRSYLTLAEYKRETANEIKARAGHRRPAGRVHGTLPPRSIG